MLRPVAPRPGTASVPAEEADDTRRLGGEVVEAVRGCFGGPSPNPAGGPVGHQASRHGGGRFRREADDLSLRGAGRAGARDGRAGDDRELQAAQQIPAAVARRGLPDERGVDLHHCGGAGLAAGVDRARTRDQPFGARGDGAGVGELGRGPDRQRGYGAERRRGRGAGCDIGVLRRADIQHAGRAGAVARAFRVERASRPLRDPRGLVPVRDAGVPHGRLAVGAGGAAEEGDEARQGGRDRAARYLCLLPLSEDFSERRARADLSTTSPWQQVDHECMIIMASN
ncbi:cation/calcium exchanger 1-like [Iris pallida]|uniref:Cation/calcium exchanger 1-like n=1 Tax=Iris pallida TaxID=29817 RepID=A0AAX6DPQ9_IRIPA|nr:cation/calcium exchanger 1-like [Iris pallida]